MKRHITQSISFGVLSAGICSSQAAHGDVAGLRGKHIFDQHSSSPQRQSRPRLGPFLDKRMASDVFVRHMEENEQENDDDAVEDANDDAAGNDNEDAQADDMWVQWAGEYNDDDYEGYTYDDVNGWVQDAVTYKDDDDNVADDERNGWESTVKTYKDDAESVAWEFYESSPSEWTQKQWDLVFGLVFGLFATCCLFSACCAYYCMNMHDDGEEDEIKAPLSPGKSRFKPWSPRNARSPLSPRSHRNVFSDDHYKRYQEDNEDATTVNTDADGTLTASVYEPPVAAMPSSLADYTSVQREKEAKILDAWQEAKKNKPDDDTEQGVDIIIDSGSSVSDESERKKKADGNDDWNEYVNGGGSPQQRQAMAKDLNSAYTKLQESEKEDKLLEARDHQHNLVGYYL